MSILSTRRIARISAEHPKTVIAVWAVILAASIAVIVSLLSGVLSNDQQFVNTPEAERAAQQMNRLGVGDTITESIVLTATDGSFRDPAKLAAADRLAQRIQALGPDVVARVIPPRADPSLVSKDGTVAVIAVQMTGDMSKATDDIPAVLDITHAADGQDGIDIAVTGVSSINDAVNTVSEQDLRTGEAIGVGVGLIVLVVVFVALVAAVIPLILGLVAITLALALTALVGQIGDLSFFVSNMVTMMGLALGIDYSLFILSRFREERAAGVPKLDAIENAGATSARAVFFSGLTVVVALAGLLIVPLSVFISLSVGAILVAISAVLAALTLLPAIISLLGDRVNAGNLASLADLVGLHGVAARMRSTGESRFWRRVVTMVMRRPLLWFIATAGLLIIASTPYWGINTGAAGVESLPRDLEARQAFETLERELNVGQVSPVRIPVPGDPAEASNAREISAVRAAAATSPALGPAELVPVSSGGGAILVLPLLVPSTSAEAEAAVRTLRDATTLNVGGSTALNVDYFDMSDRYLPYVVAIVLACSFLILLLAFRSIVAPVVAILLNLLSVGAAFGILTLVCQDGVGADLLGFQPVETVEAWIPIFLFAVLFGLSMDYHVFLLSRIRERFAISGDNRDSIAHGIASSGRLITGAALIMVAVFGGFATGRLVMFQQMGFGLAVAILIDATVVRGILVPSLMSMLGDRNWYLPRWLGWLPHVSVEGDVPTPERAREPGPSTAARTD